MKILAIIGTAILLSGCVNQGSQINLTYNCDPIGAKLVEDGSGTVFDCPVTLAYQIPPGQSSTNINGMTAVWISGAKTHRPGSTLYASVGANQIITNPIARDPTVPGMAEDDQYALQLQEMANQQAQSAMAANQEAQNRQVFSNAVANFAQAVANKK